MKDCSVGVWEYMQPSEDYPFSFITVRLLLNLPLFAPCFPAANRRSSVVAEAIMLLGLYRRYFFTLSPLLYRVCLFCTIKLLNSLTMFM